MAWRVILGITKYIVAPFLVLALGNHFFRSAKENSQLEDIARMEDANVFQESRDVKDMTGFAAKRDSGTLDLGSLKVEQYGNNVDSMTGVYLESGGKVGSIVSKGMEIDQKADSFEQKIHVSPEVEFGKVAN